MEYKEPLTAMALANALDKIPNEQLASMDLSSVVTYIKENVATKTALVPDISLIVDKVLDVRGTRDEMALFDIEIEEPRYFLEPSTGAVATEKAWFDSIMDMDSNDFAEREEWLGGVPEHEWLNKLTEVRAAITHDELEHGCEWGPWVEGIWEETQGKVLYLKDDVAATAAEHFETYQKVGPEQWFGATCLEDTHGLHFLKDGDLVQVVKANPELGQEKEYIQVAQANTVDLGR